MKLQKETKSAQALSKSDQPHGRWYGDACGAAFGMELIGERWALPIVREMMLGPRRFGEIRGELPGLSAKTLTERLETLEKNGIVRRETLPPPASAQVYGLTRWGYALEPVMQELGRWAVSSTLHDPTLPITPVSLMLSMRTMIRPERIGDLAITIGFDVGDKHFIGNLGAGELNIRTAQPDDTPPDIRFIGGNASAFLPVFYGKWSIEEAGGQLRIEGDEGLAQRVIDLFSLPANLTS